MAESKGTSLPMGLEHPVEALKYTGNNIKSYVGQQGRYIGDVIGQKNIRTDVSKLRSGLMPKNFRDGLSLLYKLPLKTMLTPAYVGMGIAKNIGGAIGKSPRIATNVIWDALKFGVNEGRNRLGRGGQFATSIFDTLNNGAKTGLNKLTPATSPTYGNAPLFPYGSTSGGAKK